MQTETTTRPPRRELTTEEWTALNAPAIAAYAAGNRPRLSDFLADIRALAAHCRRALSADDRRQRRARRVRARRGLPGIRA